MVIAQAGSIV